LLHVSVTSNNHQADISVHGQYISLLSKCLKFYTENINNMGSHTVSTEPVMSGYWNVCQLMVTYKRNM